VRGLDIAFREGTNVCWEPGKCLIGILIKLFGRMGLCRYRTLYFLLIRFEIITGIVFTVSLSHEQMSGYIVRAVVNKGEIPLTGVGP
jgi:hypothetical protein